MHSLKDSFFEFSVEIKVQERQKLNNTWLCIKYIDLMEKNVTVWNLDSLEKLVFYVHWNISCFREVDVLAEEIRYAQKCRLPKENAEL